ncbi:MAG: 2-dehydropantoate 2-reductase [Chthoniobacteraceae bacterium]
MPSDSYHPRIAVVGSGAIGSYYGAKLAALGHDVHFLMRSDLKTVCRDGLIIHSVDEPNLHLYPVQAYGSTREIGPVDLVIIAVKTTANAALERLLPPLLHEKTTLVTLQNGLGNERFLAERFGAERVMGALCFICLNRIAPGAISHLGSGAISVGEYQGPPKARTRALVAALNEAGVNAQAVENLITERWRKEVWNVPFNGLAIAAGGLTTDLLLASKPLEDLIRGLMAEIVAIAAAYGHHIPADFVNSQLERTRPMGDYHPSSLLDYQNGLPVEVEAIWGEPLREARKAGVPAGRLEMLYRMIQHLTVKPKLQP